MSKKLTPDEITEKLVKWNPEDDYLKVPDVEHTTTPVPPVERKSATELLKSFLDANNIVLSVSPPSEGIKTVSDGSVIFSAPKIIIQYRQ